MAQTSEDNVREQGTQNQPSVETINFQLCVKIEFRQNSMSQTLSFGGTQHRTLFF